MDMEQLANAEEIELEEKYASLFVGYKDILTVSEVAQILRISRESVYKLIRADEIKSIKLVRNFIIARVWVLEYLQLHGRRQEKNACAKRKAETLRFCATPRSKAELLRHFGLVDKIHFMRTIIQPLLEQGKLCRTIPEVPNHLKQKYVAADK